jgi:hypothetical protein
MAERFFERMRHGLAFPALSDASRRITSLWLSPLPRSAVSLSSHLRSIQIMHLPFSVLVPPFFCHAGGWSVTNRLTSAIMASTSAFLTGWPWAASFTIPESHVICFWTSTS